MLHTVAVDGSSDEIDVDAMKVLNDNEFVHKHNVGTMNSQNWCRVMVQVSTVTLGLNLLRYV